MLYRDLLLEKSNPAGAGDATVGALIAARGKEMLWNDRPAQCAPDVIVVHYISAEETEPEEPFRFDAILRRFCDGGVSSHYLIDRQGDVVRLVPEDNRAWHCGGSIMPDPDNRRNVNDFSIGIELVATHVSGFSDEQYRSLVLVCKDIRRRHEHTFTFVGHEHIAGERAVSLGLRPSAKIDPGPLFDWGRFHADVE